MTKIRIANKTNPVYKAFDEVNALMIEKGLTIEICGSHTFVTLDSVPNQKFELIDAEDGTNPYLIPPMMEYKLRLVDENW